MKTKKPTLIVTKETFITVRPDLAEPQYRRDALTARVQLPKICARVSVFLVRVSGIVVWRLKFGHECTP